MTTTAVCAHLAGVTFLPDASTRECAECIAAGDTWVHLRMCLECGNVGCCDSSKNRHATRHYQGTGHPVIRSLEPGERWVWCFIDEQAVEL
jgi:uncharacterized UBP type Zn finger protein